MLITLLLVFPLQMSEGHHMWGNQIAPENCTFLSKIKFLLKSWKWILCGVIFSWIVLTKQGKNTGLPSDWKIGIKHGYYYGYPHERAHLTATTEWYQCSSLLPGPHRGISCAAFGAGWTCVSQLHSHSGLLHLGLQQGQVPPSVVLYLVLGCTEQWLSTPCHLLANHLIISHGKLLSTVRSSWNKQEILRANLLIYIWSK